MTANQILSWLECQPKTKERDAAIDLINEIAAYDQRNGKGNYYIVFMGPDKFKRYLETV